MTESEYPRVELASAGSHGSSTHTRRGWKLEVRTTYHQPTVISADFVIDYAWRAIPITGKAVQWGTNIPVGLLDRGLIEHGFCGRTAIEAHRWAFLAWLESAHITGALCIETRLVEVEVVTSTTTKEIGVTDAAPANPWGRVETKPRRTA